MDDFTATGDQTHVYAGSETSNTDYTVTVHLATADGVYVNTGTIGVTVDDVAPVVTLDDPAGGGTTGTAPTLTGTAGITPGDADTVTLNIYSGSTATGTPVVSTDVDVDPDTGEFSYTVDSGSPLAPGTYTFQTVQDEDAGDDATSDPQTFTVALQDPGAVTDLAATAASATEIDLTWDAAPASDYVNNFSVYESTDYGATFTLYDTTDDGSATGMNITGLTPNTAYVFDVIANNDTGSSPDNVTPVTWTPSGIVAPTLSTPTAAGLNGYSLSWTDTSTTVQHYQVEVEMPGTSQFVTVATLDPSVTSYQFNSESIAGISSGEIWSTEDISFRIRALGYGDSAYSEVETGTADRSSFMDNSYTTDLTLSGDGTTLNWTQTNSQDWTLIMVRNVGQTAWSEFNWVYGSANSTGVIPADYLYGASGLELAVETYNLSDGVISNDAVSNIITIDAARTGDAPVLISATVETGGVYFTWTDTDPCASFTFYDAAGGYSAPAIDPSLGGESSGPGTTSAFISTSTCGLSGKFVMIATDGSNLSPISNAVDVSVPATPTGIAATAVQGGMSVVWNNEAPNETGFVLERSANDGGAWTVISSSIAAGATNYLDTTIAPGGSYLYAIKATGSNDAGATYSDWDTMGTEVSAVQVAAVVETIGFGATNSAEFHAIEKDDSSGTYGTTQYDDNDLNGQIGPGETDAPICYTRSGTTAGDVDVTMNVALAVSADPGEAVEVRASADLGGDEPVMLTFAAVVGTYAGPAGGAKLGTVSATLTTWDALPSEVEDTSLVVGWEISYDGGGTWTSVGATTNTLYITDANPVGGYPLFETVLDIGCSAANGFSATSDVLSQAWASFATNSVYRVDGKLMSYSHIAGTALTAADMLGNATGDGQCTAWADLLVQVLGAQGIGATDTRIDPAAGISGFRVALMPAQGSGANNYLTTDFGFHEVVMIDGDPDSIYDPSYGVLVQKTDARTVEQKYEDQTLVALAIPDAAHPGQYLWLPNVKGQYHVTFTP